MAKHIPKPGERIELVLMTGDPAPVAPGSRGTVKNVQTIAKEALISVDWDSGRTLSLIGSLDRWKNLSRGR